MEPTVSNSCTWKIVKENLVLAAVVNSDVTVNTRSCELECHIDRVEES